MLPGDRLLCALVEPLEIGYAFPNWPLHVTIVPWFRIDKPSEQLVEGLTKAFATVKPFAAIMGKEVLLGPKKNRPANLVVTPSPFEQLEQLARNYLHKTRAMLVDETIKRQRAYLPHVTKQQEQSISPDEELKCDRLFIIEQAGDCKRVVGEIKLG